MTVTIDNETVTNRRLAAAKPREEGARGEAGEAFTPVSNREMLELRRALRQAMQDSDEWVVEFEYCDSKGGRTRRVVSPIRFMGADRVLGLCLSREEPRQFHLNRCRRPQLKRATEYLMPVPMLVFESPVEFAVEKE
jgi:predicted DNA-binding transcriptional regulator YafY